MARMIRKILARLGRYAPKPGDVVLDRYDGQRKTVEAVEDKGRVALVWFEGSTLRRGSTTQRIARLGFIA